MDNHKFNFLRNQLSKFDNKSSFEDSVYQKNIYKWVSDSQGNAMINAVAGSGKTATLIKSLNYIPSNAKVLLVAFNKIIADELNIKIKNQTTHRRAIAKTVHSLGWGLVTKYLGVKQCNVDSYKYQSLIKASAEELEKRFKGDGFNAQEIESTLREALRLCMVTLTNPIDTKELSQINKYYGIGMFTKHLESYGVTLEFLLKEASEQAIDQNKITYDEMIYLPYAWNIQVQEQDKFDFILCDEAQDISESQLKIIQAYTGEKTRLIYVGDPYQSIYGFVGAKPNSFYQIKRQIGAIDLPLSICYRCPKSHIALAQTIVSSIEAAPNAKEGKITDISLQQMTSIATPNDLLIARKSATLVKTALYFLKQGIPARIKGADIITGLLKLISSISRTPGFLFHDFLDFLEFYREQQIEKLSKENSRASTIGFLEDQLDCLRAFFETFSGKCSNVLNFKNLLNQIFEDRESCIKLSTVHKAKGLEAENVFIIQPGHLPLTWQDQQDWQFEQEVNLRYVAFTRAKENLYFVEA